MCVLAFNVDELTDFCVSRIQEFSKSHGGETFYAFAIDASLLCLNSLERFQESLTEYQSRSPEYYTDGPSIEYIKSNTGDWAYQGFASMHRLTGWDEALYQKHYDYAMGATDEEAAKTSYGRAMAQVIRNLKEQDAFASLRRTVDFYAKQVEHSY
ncbi:MAG: DUF4303 domain-containing protein [Pseudomonadota bacterium]